MNKIKQAKQLVKFIKSEVENEIYEVDDIDEIETIKQERYKLYDEVYTLYGKEAYLKCVPKKVRNMDVCRLLEEERYLELYEKHGEKEIKRNRNEIMSNDIYYETGSKLKKIIYNIKSGAKSISKNVSKYVAIGSAALFATGNVATMIDAEVRKNNALEQNEKEIIEYLDSVDKYAQTVKGKDLTDIEIIMKVMYDMWSNIKGYGTPQKDYAGYFGVDMSSENGVGVCRNMADDSLRKYNAINSKYNARLITVEMSKSDGSTDFADVEKKYNEENGTNTEIEEISEFEKIVKKVTDKIIKKVKGNHAVVLLDIPEDDVTLIVDPTNPSIGIYKNGEIKMFNSTGLKYERRWLHDEAFVGFDACKFPVQYIESFLPCDLSDEELEEKYGLKAQNDALMKIKKEEEYKETIESLYERIEQYYKNQGIDTNNIGEYIRKSQEPKIQSSIEKSYEKEPDDGR